MTLSRLSLIGAASIGASLCFGTGTQAVKGRDLLLRSLEKAHTVAVSGIFSQRMFGGSRCEAQVKIDQDRNGRTRMTLLQPLSKQGIQSLDDGRTWKTYLPDEKRLIIQASPRSQIGDPRQRFQLADKNYTFKIETGEVIAGRKTLCVTAVPKFTEMPSRRYSIDDEHDFMLRLETVNSDGERSIQMDTKFISYPAQMPQKMFELDPLGDVRIIKLPVPEKMTSIARAQTVLGFRPVLPESLPAGFVVTQPDLAGDDDEAKVLAVRISDGLVHATVYQWNARSEQPWEASKRDREVQGIRMRVIGEVPHSVITKLLDAFIREAVKKASPYMELGTTMAMLIVPEKSETVDETQASDWSLFIELSA